MYGSQEGWDPRPDERRLHPRRKVMLPGSVILSGRPSHQCVISDVSLVGVAVITHAAGIIGEPVVVFAEPIGRLEGHIARLFPGGFGVALTGSCHAAEAYARQFAVA